MNVLFSPAWRTLVLLVVALATPTAMASAPQLDLLVSRDAVYRVSFETLAENGMTPIATRRLALSNLGTPVPFWLDGPDPERFGPGSSLTFLGEHRRGATSRFDPHSAQNAYRLTVEPRWPWFRSSGQSGIDLTPAAAPTTTSSSPSAAVSARVVRTLEEDRVRVRFNPVLGKTSRPAPKPRQHDPPVPIRTDCAMSTNRPVPYLGPGDPGGIGGGESGGSRNPPVPNFAGPFSQGGNPPVPYWWGWLVRVANVAIVARWLVSC